MIFFEKLIFGTNRYSSKVIIENLQKFSKNIFHSLKVQKDKFFFRTLKLLTDPIHVVFGMGMLKAQRFSAFRHSIALFFAVLLFYSSKECKMF